MKRKMLKKAMLSKPTVKKKTEYGKEMKNSKLVMENKKLKLQKKLIEENIALKEEIKELTCEDAFVPSNLKAEDVLEILSMDEGALDYIEKLIGDDEFIRFADVFVDKTEKEYNLPSGKQPYASTYRRYLSPEEINDVLETIYREFPKIEDYIVNGADRDIKKEIATKNYNILTK